MRVDLEKRRVYPALSSIKGIGDAVARTIAAAAPFESYDDMALKLHGTRLGGVRELGEGVPPEECSGVVGLLAKSGALRSMD